MATVVRSNASLAATTLTSVHTVTTGGTFNVEMCNRTSSAVTVRIAIINGAPGSVADKDYIEYGATVPANEVLIRSAEAVPASWQICGYASATGISMTVCGIEG